MVKRAFDATVVNSPTFTALEGFTGSSSPLRHINLNFNPTANGTIISQNDICVMWGIGNDVSEAYYDIGGKDAADVFLFSRANSGGTATFRCNDATNAGTANTNTIKHYAMSRGNALNYDSYINLVKSNKTIASTGLLNIDMGACCYNNVGTFAGCNKQLRYVFIFKYLTEAQVTIVTNAVETYLDSNEKGLM